jgi:hypothetical protein
METYNLPKSNPEYTVEFYSYEEWDKEIYKLLSGHSVSFGQDKLMEYSTSESHSLIYVGIVDDLPNTLLNKIEKEIPNKINTKEFPFMIIKEKGIN